MPPDQRVNAAISRAPHDCRLPRHRDDASSIDPYFGGPASVNMIIRCVHCGALWRARQTRIDEGLPERVWYELHSVFPWRMSQWRDKSVRFDYLTAYQRPDWQTIDWSTGGPPKLNGYRWLQSEFVEMLGFGARRCVESNTLPPRKIGQVTVREQIQCALRTEHAGDHEARNNEQTYVWPATSN